MKKERRPRSLARAVLGVVLVAMLSLLVLPAVATAANSPTIDIVYQNYVVNNSDYLGWIFGSGFQPGCKVYIGQYGGASYAASKVQFNSSGFLVVTVPMKNAQPGNYNVYVANPDGKWAWKLNSFSVHAAPTIDLVYSTCSAPGFLDTTLRPA